MSSSRAQSATNLQMCARCRTSLAHEKRTFAALSQLWFTLQALPSRPQRLLAGATETGPDQAVPMGPGDLGRAVPSCVRACVRACGSWGVRACGSWRVRARVWELARACARAVTSACPPRYAPAAQRIVMHLRTALCSESECATADPSVCAEPICVPSPGADVTEGEPTPHPSVCAEPS